MRQVAGVVTGIILALSILYFAEPMLTNSKTAMASLVNATDPNIATATALGNGFYLALPLLSIACAAFLIIAYALRRSAYE